ncbi:DinB family protein [Rubrivirga sp.]|uniref:DinB family protein n=1 Tax=Rubrivirga sp. TaxID=1885344 RepID=UPI003B52B0D9
MSDFARPPRYDAADARAYVDHMLALVGDRDPLALLGAAPDRLEAAVAGLSETDARRAPEPGAWSVLQILRHLADSEVVYGYRLRLIVAADRTAIPGYDQDAWANALHYHRGTVAEAINDLAAGRRMTLGFLRALDAGRWDRVGLHSERGEESVRRIATLLAAHDLAHQGQIERARTAIGG